MAACAKAGEQSSGLEAEGARRGCRSRLVLQATLMACRAVGDAASAVRAYRWRRRADVADADEAPAPARVRPDQVSLKLLLDCVAREPPPSAAPSSATCSSSTPPSLTARASTR